MEPVFYIQAPKNTNGNFIVCLELRYVFDSKYASGTHIHIEEIENNFPCNILESILLGSYLSVITRDAVLAPISFLDWRNNGMELFKKRILIEVEETN
ncbi:hypothetical protein M5K25_017886 [Dendrobium thyrsiflorum]|uniref:Uncharacterized protein n=1 Tax=Dendrobium thyrsiflorum TaxID=117978 RepID=A0ABD0UNF8_DENTH